MKKISILGCGWLGLPLAKALIKEGYQVKGSTTSEDKIQVLQSSGIDPYLIGLPSSFEEKAMMDFLNSPILFLNIPPRRRRKNVEKTHLEEIKILHQFIEKSPVEKLIFISSTGVYGDSGGIVSESSNPDPSRVSGKVLVAVEKFLSQQKSFQTTTFRMGGLVGGDRQAGRFLAGKKGLQNGGTPVNMVHRDDCINIIQKILAKNIWGEVFNVCADEHPTRKEFYTIQAKNQGFDPPDFDDVKKGDFKIISNEKIKRTLNYQFKYPNPLHFP